jgi:hypothetical protein
MMGVPSKRPRLTATHALGHGLTPVQLRRLAALGLPVLFVVAVWSWAAQLGVGNNPDLNGVEYFAGCESFSNACRDRGMVMSCPQLSIVCQCAA